MYEKAVGAYGEGQIRKGRGLGKVSVGRGHREDLKEVREGGHLEASRRKGASQRNSREASRTGVREGKALEES